ncbi:hypothetical protein HMPREF9999_00035, partial [Alloprevotella sp. oral taxon 473 str. F0040]
MIEFAKVLLYNEIREERSFPPLSAKWCQDDFKMVVKTAFKKQIIVVRLILTTIFL